MSYASTQLAYSPLVYYRFGDASGTTAVDASGNGRDGTYTPNSAGAWTGGTLGVAGALTGDADTAATANGSTGYVSRASFAGLNFGSSDYWMSLWLNPAASTLTNARRQSVVSKDSNAGVGRQFTLEINGEGTSATRGAIRMTLFSSDSVYVAYDTAVDVLSEGVWQHILAGRSGNAFAVWVNGVSKSLSAVSGSSGFPRTMQSTTTALNIGRRVYAGANDYYSGSIDEVAIVAGTPTLAIATDLYNAGLGASTFPAAGGMNLGGF